MLTIDATDPNARCLVITAITQYGSCFLLMPMDPHFKGVPWGESGLALLTEADLELAEAGLEDRSPCPSVKWWTDLVEGVLMVNTLDELCSALRNWSTLKQGHSLVSLPTYSTNQMTPPTNKTVNEEGDVVLSWDNCNVLVGTCAQDLRVVPVAKWEGRNHQDR